MMPPRAQSRRWHIVALPALLVLALLLGAGSTFGTRLDGWLSGAGCFALIVLLGGHASGRRPVSRSAWTPLALLALLVGYAGLQSLALPDSVLAGPHLQARGALDLAGLGDVAVRWSLDPDATLRFVLAFAMPAAIFVATAGAERRERRLALGALVVLAVGAVAWAVAQRAGGPVWLTPYGEAANEHGAFFANANHFGLFLALSFIALALIAGSKPIMVLFALLVAIGVVASGSRAAIVLWVASVIGTGLVAMLEQEQEGQPPRRRRALAAFLFVATLSAAALFMAVPGVDSEQRLAFWPPSLAIGIDALPFGTGMGSFESVYRVAQPLSSVGHSYVNEAHNEPLQWLVEGGIAGLALLCLFILWLGRRLRPGSAVGLDRRERLLVAVALCLCLGHSLVDYPLRTIAGGSLFAFFCGLLCAPAERREARIWPLLASLPVGVAAVALAPAPFLAEDDALRGQTRSALEHWPDHAQARAYRANALYLEGDKTTARDEARAALARQPVLAEALAGALGDELAMPDIARPAASQLGWRNTRLQQAGFFAAASQADWGGAAHHAEAMLRRNTATGLVRDWIQAAMIHDDFRSPLIASKVAERAVVLDLEPQPGAIEGVEALARDPAFEPRPDMLRSLFYRMISQGRGQAASDLYRSRFGATRDLASEAPAGRRGDTPDTPFGWLFNADVDDTKRMIDRGLSFAGDGTTSNWLALRHLALPDGDYRASASLRVERGQPAMMLELRCAGTLAASDRFDPTARVTLSVDTSCPLPELRIVAVAGDRRYRASLVDWSLVSARTP